MLSSLSVDCLQLILALVPAQDIGALWLSGNALVNRNLSHSVTKLDVELRTWLPLTWPRLVTSLPKLTSLSISHYNTNQDDIDFLLPISGFCWSLVPKTLVSFSISIDLKDSPFVIDTELPLLEELRIRFKTNTGRNFPNLALWTPNLKTLSWIELEPVAELGLLDLSLLPPCLTDLGFNHTTLKNSGASWPPSLTRLSLKANLSVDLFFQLPSSLTDLSSSSPPPSGDDWTHLPNLQYLQGPFWSSSLSQIPRSLISLGDLTMIRGNEPLSFPPHLTSLKLSRKIPTFDEKVASALPRSLTSIKGSSVYIPSKSIASVVSLLPPNLEYECLLELIEPRLVNSMKTHKQITSLNLVTREPADLSNLPPNLQHLNYRLLSPTNIQQLPPFLKTLQRFDFDRFQKPSFSVLPRQLTKLTTVDLNTFSGALSLPSGDLPRTLTDLHIPRCTIKDESWFSELPHNLTRLDLGLSDQTSEEIFQTKLPLNITYLKLSLWDTASSETYLAVIDCLPHHLVYLNIHVNVFYQDADLTGLRNENMALFPRGLLHIIIPPSRQLTSSCVPYLPPNLTRLTCSGQTSQGLRAHQSPPFFKVG